jgi:exosortase F-associated protein
MLKNLLKNKRRVGVGIFLLLLLIAIRAFENTIFYDPFLDYFKSEYANLPLPQTNPIKLFLSLGFRFYLNSMISLALLYVIFKDNKIIKFSIFLFSIFGIVLMISFFFTLKFFPAEKMTLFYLRRFIIQPILLILFVPAFYYQRKMK